MLDKWLERQGFWLCVWVGLVAVVLYLPTLSFGYVNLDDPWLIQNNVLLHQWDWDSLHTVWFDLSVQQRLRLGGEFLPLRDTSVMLDFTLFGGWVGGFHLTQVLLYGLLCGLVCALALTWFRAPWMGLVGGLLFAVHPLHVEAVSWLSERKGLLAGIFLFASVLAFYRFVQKGRYLSLLLALLFAALGVWSKAIALTNVAFLASLLWFFPPWRKPDSEEEQAQQPEPPQDQGPRVRAWLGWLVVSVVIVAAFYPVWLAGKRVNMVQGYHGGSLWSTIWLMGKVHTTYILQLLGVSGLSIKYPVAVSDGQTVKAIAGLLLALLFVGVGVAGLVLKKLRWFAFASWCWMIFLAPVSQVLLPLQNYIADRYLLLPSLGFVIVLTLLLKKLPSAKLSGIATVGLVALFSINTLVQSQSWSSTTELYRQALRVHPSWVPGMMQLARLEARRGRMKEAMALIRRAKAVNPNHPKVAIRESLFLVRKGKTQQAISILRKAAQTSKDDKVRANLALLLQRVKKLEEAYKWAKESVTIRPMVPHNQRVLGVVALSLKRWEVAQKALQTAYDLEPFSPQNAANLGVLYHHLKQPEKAASYFRRAQQLGRQRARQRRR